MLFHSQAVRKFNILKAFCSLPPVTIKLNEKETENNSDGRFAP